MRFYIGLILFAFSFSFNQLYGSCSGSGLTPRQQDSCQLINLHANLDGSNWSGTKWNLTQPMNTWSGVVLHSSGRVRSISLSNRSVMGRFPSGFSLPELESLTISFTTKGSRFINEKLPDFANFPQLKVLNLSNNNLNDTLPDALPISLTNINLSGNLLYGKIPNYYLPDLTLLRLTTNGFTGFKSKLNCPKLEYLYLQSNSLSDTIPNFHLPQLKVLNLSSNSLTGSVPQLDSVANLEELYLNLNQLNGSLPNLSLTQLKILNVASNKLVGAIPSLMTPNLTELRLNNNLFTGSIPNFNLSQLQNLYAGTNPSLTGTFPAFDNLPGLILISITGTGMNGSVPLFASSSLLERITLSNNKLDDTIPDFNLPKLKILDLSVNQLVGKIPIFNFLPDLEELVLFQNKLEGTIPDFNLPKLRILNLSGNKLTGTINNFSLANLESFAAHVNTLTGALPTFNSMPRLRTLNLSNNLIQGELPSGIDLPSLKDLILSTNLIHGEVPENFLELLPKISLLSLDVNYITGSIPDFVSDSLTSLNLGYNNLSGEIPLFGNALKLKNIYVDHNYLSGNIPDYKSQAGRDTSGMIINIAKNYFSFGNIATSPYNTVNNYSYLGQIIPLFYNFQDNKLVVNAGYVHSPSENTYKWIKRCSSTEEILSGNSPELVLPVSPDGCRYRCIISNSVIEKDDMVRIASNSTGLFKKLVIGSYFYTHSKPQSSCTYSNDTLRCPNVWNNIDQGVLYQGDSLFSKGITPLHFKYPEKYFKARGLQTTSQDIGVLIPDTSGLDLAQVILPDYVPDYVSVGGGKKLLGKNSYEFDPLKIGRDEQINYDQMGIDDLCETCDSIEADFLYLYAIITDTTSLYDKTTGKITIPFRYIDYKHNTEAPYFRIYYSVNGTNTPSSFIEISTSDITLQDSIFFVRFTLPGSAISSSAAYLNYDNFKYKIEASSQSGRTFKIISDYFLYYRKDVAVLGYMGNHEDRFNVVENLKKPTCKMFWYGLYDNTKFRTNNNYELVTRINNNLLTSGWGTEEPVDNSYKQRTATIQRGGIEVKKLPSCYTIDVRNGSSTNPPKTFFMDYKLVCIKKKQ